MAASRKPGTAGLALKTSAFTLVVPGAVVVLGPYLLLADASLGAIDVLGMSLLGVLPIILGAALYSRCAFEFIRSGRGTPAPIDPPTRLVMRGPYGYSRNPMYVGVLAMLVGEALLYRDPALLYFLLAVAGGFHLFIVTFEEPLLRRQFGESYAQYREAVPRWIPRWPGLEVLYRRSFLKVGTLVLAAGTVAHVMRLTVGLPLLEMPVSIHAFLVVLPAYAVFGCIAYARRINLTGLHHKLVFALIVLLLSTTVVMHAYSIAANDNQWQGIFPMWYSVLAVVAYGGFAHFLETRLLR